MRRMPSFRLCFSLRSWLKRLFSLVASMRLCIVPGDTSRSPLSGNATTGSLKSCLVERGVWTGSTMGTCVYIPNAGMSNSSKTSSKARSNLKMVMFVCYCHPSPRRRHREQLPISWSAESHLIVNLRRLEQAFPFRNNGTSEMVSTRRRDVGLPKTGVVHDGELPRVSTHISMIFSIATGTVKRKWCHWWAASVRDIGLESSCLDEVKTIVGAQEGTTDAKPFTVGLGYYAMLGLASTHSHSYWLI